MLTRRLFRFQHRLDLVGEGQQLLGKKLDEARADLKADMARVDYRLTVAEARIGQRIGGMAERRRSTGLPPTSESIVGIPRGTGRDGEGWKNSRGG